MKKKENSPFSLTFRPLTAARWPDLEALFGPRGACGGCWCMAWRQSASEFHRRKGESNRKAFRKIVLAGPPPGVLAYDGKVPVGWCAIAPREEFVRLESSRVLARVDEKPVWSAPCFFVARKYRNSGVSAALLRAAAELARKHGAKIVEGYPVRVKKGRLPDVFVWTGLVGTFRKAGFREVERRSPTRPIMRKTLS